MIGITKRTMLFFIVHKGVFSVTIKKKPNILFNKIRTLILILFIILFTTTCSKSHFPSVPIDELSRYTMSKSSYEITVAIDPYTEKTRLVKYFSVNLLKKYNILPIQIIIQKNTSQSIIVDSQNITLQSFNDTSIPRLSLPLAKKKIEDDWHPEYVHELGALTFIAIFFPILYPIYLPPLGVSIQHSQNSVDAMWSIGKNALLDRILYDNEIYTGFVYFNIEKSGQPKFKGRLKVALKNSRTGDVYDYDFFIDKNIE